jgi:hypothetical protein
VLQGVFGFRLEPSMQVGVWAIDGKTMAAFPAIRAGRLAAVAADSFGIPQPLDFGAGNRRGPGAKSRHHIV